VIVRLVLWNLFDSQTTLDELRARLPELRGDDVWIANPAQERFGLIAFGELPDVSSVTALIGAEPAVAEEFDVLD
jgi:hypothetical protein